jgi:hypothetical protein
MEEIIMTNNSFDLLNLEPQKISTDMSSYTMLVYGNPKIGKTTFVHSTYEKEGALILATEKGYKALAGAFVMDVTNWANFMKVIRELKKPEVKERFKTIIIDTVDILWTYVEKFVLAKHNVDSISDIPYGQGWGELSSTFFEGLNSIEKEGYNLAFISHATTKTEKIPGTKTEYEKYIPTIPKRGLAIVSKMVDNILFAAVAQDAEGQEQRVLYARETMQWQAGGRFKAMAPVFHLTAESYKKAMSDAIAAEGKKNLKKEKEVAFVAPPATEESDFEVLMKKAKTCGVKFHKASRMPELTAIVEKCFGVGKKLTEATPNQVEALTIAVQEMEDRLAELGL